MTRKLFSFDSLILFLVTLVFMIMFWMPSNADSLWNANNPNWYAPSRAYKTGDLLTILISEQTIASNIGDTRSDKRQDLDFNTQLDIQTPGSPSNRNQLDLTGTGVNRFVGRGRTTRNTQFNTRVTAEVIEVRPNGDLLIIGKRTIQINSETETLKISGIVRPGDISPDNTINSIQIAQANIYLDGKGTVSSPQKPGLLSNMFNFLF
jgi:flagellar L-ring protein precursor FlgH